MRLAAALVLALASCASHNSHRVQVDLAADFDALVDEAYAQLVQQWPAGEPGGAIGTHVSVEPVVVRWWPLVVIAVGATHMVNERRVLSPGITAVLIGGFALFFTLGALKWKLLLKVWPIVLVAVGASMLLGARRKH